MEPTMLCLTVLVLLGRRKLYNCVPAHVAGTGTVMAQATMHRAMQGAAPHLLVYITLCMAV